MIAYQSQEAVKSFKVQESKIVGNLLFKFIVHKIVTEAHLMEKLLRDSNGGQLSVSVGVFWIGWADYGLIYGSMFDTLYCAAIEQQFFA